MSDHLSKKNIEELCEGRLPASSSFSIGRYSPPGPVGAAYIVSDGPIDAIMGPGGSGKTIASIFKGIRFSVNKMPVCTDGRIRCKGTVIRDNYRSLYRTTLQSWFHWFPVEKHPKFFGGQDRPARHRLELSVGRMVNGVAREVPVDLDVEFFAVQDVNYELLFKSYETSWAWATEADGIDVNAIPFFYGRTARYPSLDLLPEKTIRPRVAFVDFNPPDPEHPLLAACQRGSFKDDFNPEKDPRVINFFRQPSGLAANAENRAGKTLAEYQAEMDALTKDQARRMVQGMPGRVKNGLPVYDEEFDYETHVSTAPLAILQNTPIHIGFDQDLSPAAVFFQMAPTGQIRVLREVVPAHGTGIERFLEQIFPVLMGDLRGLPPGIFAADPAGFMGADKIAGDLSWAQAMSKGLGHMVIPAPSNEPKLRRESLSVLMTRNVSAHTPALTIDPSCKMVIRGLSTGYRYQKQTNGYSNQPIKNEFSHPIEALQYGVLSVRGVAGIIASASSAGRPSNVVSFTGSVGNTNFNVWNV